MNTTITPKIKVMIVDDSTVIRGLMVRALKDLPDIDIVSSASDGQMALSQLKLTQPDVVVLDIEMPVMDGLTVLPQIIKNSPQTRVIMASTLTLRNAEISLQALALGATDYIPKPEAKDPSATEAFFRELTSKIRALGIAAISKPAPAPRPATPVAATSAPQAKMPAPSAPQSPMAARAAATTVPSSQKVAPVAPGTMPRKISALAIASSTGGPQALQTLFGAIKTRINRVPIFITQHMPPTFTTILAEHLAKASGMECHEGKDGEAVRTGVVYLAPGGYHMTVQKTGTGPVIKLNQDPPENFCRPAADPMLRSLSDVYGAELLTVVLTGMGSDGCEGSKRVVSRGGAVIAQDEASSVVWGMPRAIAEANIASAILPLTAIPDALEKAILR